MRVPLTVVDFLDRAALVYGDRVGIVDEPDQPAESLGELTYGRVRELARAQAAALDEHGIGAGRTGRDRVAQRGPAARRRCSASSGSGRILVPINFRLNADEVRLHRRAQRRARCSSSIPSSTNRWAASTRSTATSSDADSDRELFRFGAEPRAVGARRGRDRDHQLHERNHRPPEGRPAHAPQRVDQRGDVRLARRDVNDRDVYLHTLPMFHCNGWGMPYGLAGMGAKQVVLRKVDGAEILRRIDAHGVTLLNGAPAVADAILDAARDVVGRRSPGTGASRMIIAGAPPPDAHDRAHRDGAGLGVHPDLRPHRDVAAPHDEPEPGRVGRPHSDRARDPARTRRRSGDRGASRDRRRGRSASRAATS